MAPRTRRDATAQAEATEPLIVDASTNKSAKAQGPPATGSKWRPTPWNYVPDWVCVCISMVILLSGGPLQATLIITGEIVWYICLYLHQKTPAGYAINFAGKVINSVAQWFGDRMLRDPRDSPYLPWIFFLSFWAPGLYALAAYRTYVHPFNLTLSVVVWFSSVPSTCWLCRQICSWFVECFLVRCCCSCFDRWCVL